LFMMFAVKKLKDKGVTIRHPPTGVNQAFY